MNCQQISDAKWIELVYNRTNTYNLGAVWAENRDYDTEFAASSICIDDFVIVVCHLGCEKLPSYKLALNKTIAVFMRY